MLNPYSPPSSDCDNRDEQSINACPVCHTHHRRVALFARWRPCAGCGNRLFLQLPGRIQVIWICCVAPLVIVLFSFASSDQLRRALCLRFYWRPVCHTLYYSIWLGARLCLSVGGELRQQNSNAFGRHTDIAIKLQTDSYRCQAVGINAEASTVWRRWLPYVHKRLLKL